MKHDDEKAPMNLLPWAELIDVAMVLKYGQGKYSAWNWTKVEDIGRYTAALARHLAAFEFGEDLDPESGLSHLDHIACNALMAKWHMKHHPERDSRYGKQLVPERCPMIDDLNCGICTCDD